MRNGFFTLADRDNNRLVWVGVPSLLRSTTDPSIFGVNRLNYQRYKFGKKDGLITEKTRKCWRYATRPRPQPAKRRSETLKRSSCTISLLVSPRSRNSDFSTHNAPQRKYRFSLATHNAEVRKEKQKADDKS